jgi:hypothetical protein
MKLRYGLSTLCLAFALAPTPAAADNWVYIGRNTYGSVYDVDWDSLRRDGNMVTFTIRVNYGPNGPKGEADGYVAHRSANCADRSYADLQTDYMKNGSLLRSSGQEEKRTATPESIAGEVLSKVCAR